MTALTTQRYAYEPNHDGTYSITDTLTGECVGTTPDLASAKLRAQCLTALKTANEHRSIIADFKRRLHALTCHEGAALLSDCLRNYNDERDDPAFGAMQIQAALLSVRGIGRTKASIIIRQANVHALSRRVRDLTDRQRAVIAEALETWT